MRAPVPATLDLRSDTVTSPSPEMLATLAARRFGDDAYCDGGDVAVLESRCAELLGKEAAVFTGSGTMSNQLAVYALTRPGDEIVTERRYHVNFYESGATAGIGGVAINALDTTHGYITIADLEMGLASKARGELYAEPKLLCVENSIGALGGTLYPPDVLAQTAVAARRHGMRVHLDGARLYNAATAGDRSLAECAREGDTVSMCFSKGLGAPYGSILAGDEGTVRLARLLRKRVGGALHQAELLATMALFALGNRDRTRVDHEAARRLAERLDEMEGPLVDLGQVQTNMVLVDVSDLGADVQHVVDSLAAHGVLASVWGPRLIRLVCHLDVSQWVEVAADRIESAMASLPGRARSAA